MPGGTRAPEVQIVPIIVRWLSGHGTQGKHRWIKANIGTVIIVKGTLEFLSSWSIQRSESCVPLFRQYKPYLLVLVSLLNQEQKQIVIREIFLCTG